jgi:hypothetical protein
MVSSHDRWSEANFNFINEGTIYRMNAYVYAITNSAFVESCHHLHELTSVQY